MLLLGAACMGRDDIAFLDQKGGWATIIVHTVGSSGLIEEKWKKTCLKVYTYQESLVVHSMSHCRY